MAALAPFAEHVDFLYTDISPALVGYGRKTYGALHPHTRFQLLDVEKDVQCEGIGSYDVVFGTNVLHATRNMTNTLQNCKALLRRGDVLAPNTASTE
jgi:2-polyprenyl-3-methyl-5-hydroxy-6-metoxy-1,4-benzoquinol methylase